jgi:mono/diheme cytochrome c family protein
LLVICVAPALAAWISQPVANPPRSQPGWALYDRLCLPCHGATGDGRGPAAPYTASRPRDFTKGEFAWRTTALGQAPTRDDVRLTIRHGAPGTSMPGFPLLAAPEIDQLVDLVFAFAPPASPGTPITLAAKPATIDAKRGKQLWIEKGCATCHGVTGTGDVKTAVRPYDLTRQPLHRPRADGDLRRAAALAIATGRGPMPGYAGTLPDAEIWALADHVVSINVPAKKSNAIDPLAIDLDRTAKLVVGDWPGTGDDAIVWGTALPPQGVAPPQLAPVQASLSAPQCARCHAKQAREWQTSRHRGAVSPGYQAQVMGLLPDAAARCARCHAPLAEQRTDPQLHAQAVSCAGCHVRSWTRHGPATISQTLLPIPGYPKATLDIYERADFCMPCHQLPPRVAVNGRPLLDTYREWLEGPYMPRGIQCQHCHMPNREHAFRGIHDPDTFRQGTRLDARASVRDGTITVVAELANVGAGHYTPTTPTPAAWIVIELYDARGKPIEGARADHRIGRDISYEGGRWIEHADTRIAPGARAVLARAWRGGRVASATTARVWVEVRPDDYYERLYERQLARKLPADRRALYAEALSQAKAARYIASTRDLTIPR